MSPSEERDQAPAPAGPCTMVIFGAHGDLTSRLLMPALYHLAIDGLLPDAFHIVGYARNDLTVEELRARLREAVVTHVTSGIDDARLDWLVARLSCVRGTFEERSRKRQASIASRIT